jgi:hypothetical protein
MSDKELLELAAKAAGIEVKPHTNYKIHKELIFTSGGRNWNPLTDDGDALRLAVKLGFSINIDNVPTDGCCECTEVEVWQTGDTFIYNFEGDPYAATRRAIVRAAAEIGRRME